MTLKNIKIKTVETSKSFRGCGYLIILAIYINNNITHPINYPIIITKSLNLMTKRYEFEFNDVITKTLKDMKEVLKKDVIDGRIKFSIRDKDIEGINILIN